MPVAGRSNLLQYMNRVHRKHNTNCLCCRIIEEEIESAIESRNEALPVLRELGPPDLVHLVKQSVKSGGRQVKDHVSFSAGPVVDNSSRLGYTTM